MLRRGRTRSSHAGSHQLAVAEQEHHSRHDDGAHDERVEQHGAGQADAEQLDHPLAAEDERAEHEHHDRGRGGDRPTGRRQTVGDRLARVAAAVPLLVDAADQEHLVVHREAEQDREHQDREERPRSDPSGRCRSAKRPSPSGRSRSRRRSAAPTESRFITAAVSGTSTLRNTAISSRKLSSTTTPMNSGSLRRQHVAEVVEDRGVAADQDLQTGTAAGRRDDMVAHGVQERGRRGGLRASPSGRRWRSPPRASVRGDERTSAPPHRRRQACAPRPARRARSGGRAARVDLRDELQRAVVARAEALGQQVVGLCAWSYWPGQ